ncbi:hypothetical protein NQ317_017287 [Molorchus minor]|uniref:Uncharacterized protein n=1 Tax=Molorchus minor TaxID=1323400 RepID=A0ABQ9JTM4_9CUCU|nr:hypothetical protein NQ317_017287 [Molorchus minor]
MVFVCPTREETENKTKALCKLKKILNEIQDSLSVPLLFRGKRVPREILTYRLLIEVVTLVRYASVKERLSILIQHRLLVRIHWIQHWTWSLPTHHLIQQVCYKVPPKAKKKGQADESSKNKAENVTSKVKQSKSRELRASILYRGCDCEQRNGLQDDCQRTGCHGSPECLTRPPTCGPSEFCNGKHLGKKTVSSGYQSVAGGGGAGGPDALETAKYKCFAAVLKSPVPVCCAPCQ